jgi:hypothetical protein
VAEAGADEGTGAIETGEPGDDGELLDVAPGGGDGADDGGGGCGSDDGELEFSYIWVSNSTQGTISKIDTRTIVEKGRYWSRADNYGDPSRTSVSLSGDVVVANRAGGLTKIYAREDDCQDTNGTPGIQTSTGKDDVLDWGYEECVAWHTDLGYAAQRPVAWTAGTLDEQTCSYVGAKVWTAGNRDPFGAQQVWFSRVDGTTGTVEIDVEVPELDYYALGPYGGAADADGNFWFIGMSGGVIDYNTLVRVDFETTDYTIHALPAGTSAYGITVDHEGRPWTAGTGVTRFDPETQTFDHTLDYGGCGLMEDAKGRMWIANQDHPEIGSVIALDVESMGFVKGLLATVLDGGAPVFAGKGVSIDFDGYVWQIGKSFTKGAFRFDPETGEYQTYEGLDQPYTYSDMTGWGLKNSGAVNPQG